MSDVSLGQLAPQAGELFSDLVMLLIYIVLGIQTLRSVLAFSGFLKGSRFGWLVHGREIEELVEGSVNSTLAKLGLDGRDLISASEYKKTRGKLNFDDSTEIDKLIILLSKYTQEFSEEQWYGNETPTRSKYYISTMDTSLHENSCAEMVSLLENLYLSHVRTFGRPDFILSSKKGNALFARAFANKLNIPLVLCKGKKDGSTLKLDKSKIKPVNNIEGLVHLQELSKESQKKMSGIFVDCNCSGGSSIREAIKFFNDTIDSNKINNISPLKDLFMLYRADNELNKENFIRGNSNTGLNSFWYFDCNEPVKKELRELGEMLNRKGSKAYSRDVKAKTTSIHNMLREKELIYQE